jgi:hypothetical protein
MALNRATGVADRAAERRRAVALAMPRGLPIAQIVERRAVTGDDQGLFL